MLGKYLRRYFRDIKAICHNKNFSRVGLFFTYHRLCLKFAFTKVFKIKTEKDAIMGFVVEYDDFKSFFDMYIDLFIHSVYMLPKVESSEKIVIADCGANIGLSIFFFKHFFPNSKIFAFEPDKDIFRILEKNVRSNNLSNVKLYNKAVGSDKRNIKFYSSSGCGGSQGNTIYKDLAHSKGFKESIVEEITLSSLNLKMIDVLKIDVEGAEGIIFEDLYKNNLLKKVELINLEYHYGRNLKNNNLSLILKRIEDSNFDYIIKSEEVANEINSREDFIKARNYHLILQCFRE